MISQYTKSPATAGRIRHDGDLALFPSRSSTKYQFCKNFACISDFTHTTLPKGRCVYVKVQKRKCTGQITQLYTKFGTVANWRLRPKNGNFDPKKHKIYVHYFLMWQKVVCRKHTSGNFLLVFSLYFLRPKPCLNALCLLQLQIQKHQVGSEKLNVNFVPTWGAFFTNSNVNFGKLDAIRI